MGVLETLTEKEQKAAYMIASGVGLKEVSSVLEKSYDHTRAMVAPNSPHRNDRLIEAVREIKAGLAEKLKGIEDIIQARCRKEIENGDPEFAHKYMSIIIAFLKDGDQPDESGKGSTKIQAVINQVFKT